MPGELTRAQPQHGRTPTARPPRGILISVARGAYGPASWFQPKSSPVLLYPNINRTPGKIKQNLGLDAVILLGRLRSVSQTLSAAIACGPPITRCATPFRLHRAAQTRRSSGVLPPGQSSASTNWTKSVFDVNADVLVYLTRTIARYVFELIRSM